MKSTPEFLNGIDSKPQLHLELRGDTTPPVITLHWPLNNAIVSADTFTLRGALDDPTAAVSVSGLTDDPVEGLVERNGLFWVEELPLQPGNNTLTLTATDAAGNAASSTLTVVKSTVNIAIDGVSEAELVQPKIPLLTGSISASGYTVWVNGVRANDDGALGGGLYGWSAANVPLGDGGTAVLQARSIPTSDNGGNGSGPDSSPGSMGNPASSSARTRESQEDKPARVLVTWYLESWKQDLRDSELIARDEYKHQQSFINWKLDVASQRHWVGDFEPWQSFPNPVPAVNHQEKVSSWPADTWPPTWPGILVSTDDMGGYDEVPVAAPLVPLEVCDAVDNRPGSVWDRDVYTRIAYSRAVLQTGGKAKSGRRSLFTLSVSVNRVTNKRWRPEHGEPAPLEPLDPAWYWTYVGALGQVGRDGNLYAVLPDNQSIQVTPHCRGCRFFTFDIWPTKHRARIYANGTPLPDDGAQTPPMFCVGQKINLAAGLEPEPSAIPVSTRWSLPADYVNVVIPAQGERSPRYEVDAGLTQQQNTSAWWIDGSYDGAVKRVSCRRVLRFANGQNAVVYPRGYMLMHRPRILAGFTCWLPRSFRVLTSYFPDTLSYGDDTLGDPDYGLHWRATVQSRLAGRSGVTQLINGQYTQLGVLDIDKLDTDGNDYLDQREFYHPTWPLPFLDLPDYPRCYEGQVKIDDFPSCPMGVFGARMTGTFSDYIRFKPGEQENDGNIYVTLGLVYWSM